MIELEKERLYEDDWNYTSSIEMNVSDEIVYVTEFDYEITNPKINRPNCQRRIISVRLEPLMNVMSVSENDFIWEMKTRFGRFDGVDLLRSFLDEHNIDYDFREGIA